MRRCWAVVLLLAAALLPVSPAAAGHKAAPALPDPGVTVERGIVFGSARDHAGREQVLRMDLYRPPHARLAPAVVWIHGGGFTRGDRTLMEPYTRFFARRGYVAATIDYRLAPRWDRRVPGRTPPVRDAQHDAQAAVRYLRARAAALGLDPRRIYAAGTSAGAITALNVALHPDDPGASGTPGVSSRVRAAVSVAGFAPAPRMGAGDPPLLLLHGTADRVVDFGLAGRTCRRAHAAGVRCRLVALPGAGHHMIWQRLEQIAGLAARWLERVA